MGRFFFEGGNYAFDDQGISLKHSCNTCIQRGLTHRGRMARAYRVVLRAFTLEEEEALLAGCTGKLSHLRPIVTCILYGGFRRGELLQLHWGDVSFHRRTITLRSEMTKTNRSGIIPMHNRVIDALRWCENRFGDDERVVPINDIKNAWGTLRAKINRPDLHLHDLRATFATRLLNNGVPLHIVQILMGHTTTLITLKHYSRPDDTLLKKAIETLPNGFWTVQEIREVLASSSLRS